MKNLKITTKFLLLSGAIVSVLIIGFAVFLVDRSISRDEHSIQSKIAQMSSSIDKKGELLANFISTISADAVMSQDVYSLKVFASQAMTDPEVVHVRILTKDSAALVDESRPHDKARTYTKVIKTDASRIGIEMELGSVEVDIDEKIIDAFIKDAEADQQKGKEEVILSFVIFVVVVNLLIAIGIFSVLKRIVINPIKSVSGKLRDISEGDGDLTTRLNYTNADEIGVMSQWFDRFVEKLHSIISQVAATTNQVNDSILQVETNATHMVEKTHTISRDSSSVSKSANEAAERINGITQTMHELANSVGNINHAVSEMNITLNEVASNCAKESEQTIKANELTINTQTKMDTLAKAASEIGKVLDVIKGFANQTNLLALNATIEAASAGEAGKGFAVVANEVKELAKQTARAAEDIESQINHIQESSHGALEAINEIVVVVEDVNTLSNSVAAAVEEQSATINQVSGNLREVSQASTRISQELTDASTWINEINSLIGNVSGEVKLSEGEIEQVQKNLGNMNAMVANLNELIAKFKI